MPIANDLGNVSSWYMYCHVPLNELSMSNSVIDSARQKAIHLLASREHSRHEIHNKLRRSFDASLLPDATLENIFDDLVGMSLLSNKRFAEVLIRSKIASGYGRLRIIQWLQEHAIESEVIDAAFSENDVDWYTLALRQKRKHFGVGVPPDIKAKSKQSRYLFGRGFDYDQISYAINDHGSDGDLW